MTRIAKPLLEKLVLDTDLSLMLPTVNRGRIGNQSLVDVHGVVHGRPAGEFVAANDDHATIEEALITQFPFTVSATINTSNTVAQTILFCGDKGNFTDFFNFQITNGDLIIVLVDGGAGTAQTHTAALDDGLDHVVMITVYVDGSDVKVDVFIDGVFAETLTSGNWATTFWSDIVADRTTVGRLRAAGESGTFNGKIRNVDIYDGKKIDTAEALRLYNGYKLDNPTAIWRFSEGTGEGADAVADISGNGNDLTTTGMGWDLGANGGDLNQTAAGRVFLGVKDYVEFPNNLPMTLDSGDFQIHVWAKASSVQTDATPYLISKGENGATEWALGYVAGGLVKFLANSSGIDAESSGTDYFDDAWHLISVVRDSAAGVLVILVDGVAVIAEVIATDSLSSGKDLQIGTAEAGAGNFFTGEIKQAWIGRATKTIAQGTLDTLALYRRTMPPF